MKLIFPILPRKNSVFAEMTIMDFCKEIKKSTLIAMRLDEKFKSARKMGEFLIKIL